MSLQCFSLRIAVKKQKEAQLLLIMGAKRQKGVSEHHAFTAQLIWRKQCKLMLINPLQFAFWGHDVHSISRANITSTLSEGFDGAKNF